MKSKILLSLFFLFALFSVNAQTATKVQTLEVTAFAKEIKTTSKPQILDVRTPEEYASEHLDYAKNINWLAADFTTNTAQFDKSKPVFVYCKSGGRSQKAVEKLAQLGFSNIYELEGGILKWNAAGFGKPMTKTVGLSQQEYAKLLDSNPKVLISFYADWCAPCKKMTPYILQMQKDLSNKVTIIRLNADENKTLIAEMKISALPTLLLYENKEVKWKHSGFINEEDLKKQL